VLLAVLLGTGDVEAAADVLDVEGSVTGANMIVAKSFSSKRDEMKALVVDKAAVIWLFSLGGLYRWSSKWRNLRRERADVDSLQIET
jgi:hypothetical protein